ncbi:translation initiation factor IF-2-like [Zalophus californianus]|uniref:Translation initiation factor IF-2-like n=1 Tax=Zalophus californianus TaxID=9704 RepID=A0A6J2F385_ZALCA|nr:translation initiation factor IF-2-like [Zalophus californianus]
MELPLQRTQRGPRGSLRPRTPSPRTPALEEGLGRRGRGRAGNLPHPGSIRAPLLSRPVAPQSASYLDVVASPPPGAGRSVPARGGRGPTVGGAGAGAGRGVRSRQVRGRGRGAKLARDAPRRGRAAASVQCARAAASVCVAAFPFLPRQSSGQTEQRAAAEKPQQPERSAALRGLRAAHSAGSGGRGRRSSGAPGLGLGRGRGLGLGLGRGSRRRARLSRSEARREQSARRLPRLGEAAGPARRPPRLFPFSLHPLAPSPLALQGRQTGLQHQPRRREPPPQSDWAPESVHGDAESRAGPGPEVRPVSPRRQG